MRNRVSTQREFAKSRLLKPWWHVQRAGAGGAPADDGTVTCRGDHVYQLNLEWPASQSGAVGVGKKRKLVYDAVKE